MGSICSTSKVVAVGEDGEDHNDEKAAAKAQSSGDDDNSTLRLLLLGAAESGKTTLLSQIRMLYKNPFSESEMIHRRAFVYNNIVDSMKAIAHYAAANDFQLSTENQKRMKDVLNPIDECLGPFSPEEYEALVNLWKDAAIQEAYKRRGEYNLNDSAKYFFENLERINQPGFQPSMADLIRAYCPTIGIQNIVFTAKNKSFQLFDIGGQKVDRRKWATMYDGLDSIFFCLAISEYDQKFEDDEGEGESRLMDSLNLLEQICKEPKFEATPIFVFLNEVDVLKEKLERFPLKNYLHDYRGHSEDEALEFLMEKVQERCASHDPDLISIQYICAINDEEMAKTLNNVFKKLLKLVK